MLRKLGYAAVMIGALAEQIDRDHGLWLEAELLRRRNAARQRFRRHVEGGRFDVDQYKILVKFLAGKARMKVVELPAFGRRDALDTLCTAS